MAENQSEESQKTEEPTQRRIEQAREKGQVAKSQEVNHWFMILAFALVVAVFAGSLTGGITTALYQFIEQPHAIRLDGGQLRQVLLETLADLGLAVLLPMAVVLLAALMTGFAQNGLVLSTESLVPKLEKISPMKGLKRLASSRSLVDFVKGVLKISIVGAVIIILLWPDFAVIANASTLGMKQFLILLQDTAARVLIGVLAIMTIIAGLDFLYQKQQHLKQLRMSKQEVKEEFKQTEGDPMIKARLRQIRMERARKRMMAAVPEADVVITNPTHYAVALKYDMEAMDAPVLVAKGADLVAQRMREVADEHGIPIVRNPPLSRALYDGVELDQAVPPEHYKAVAEVIGYVMRLSGRMPPRRNPPPGNQ
jgi:flagellar biosynthetic protein FlhB